MAVSNEDLLLLANLIKAEIVAGFSDKKLSGNLIKTISVEQDEKGIRIRIPAEMYDMEKYFREKVIVHTGKGSYAEQLNKKGSEFTAYYGKNFKNRVQLKPHNHKGFMDEAVKNGLEKWKGLMSTKLEIKRVEEIKYD